MMNNRSQVGDMKQRASNLATAVLLVLVVLVSGCAHNNPRDPLEPFNRGVYAFNDAVDSVVFKPIATGYQAVLPQFVRTGVSNFFSNLDDVTVALNSVLQFKIVQAISDTGRFLINTTVGLLGLIDVATYLGLEKHNEDFGQTLGYWGMGDGPYLVLPILGPSSLRDGVGRIVDAQTDLVRREDHVRTRNRLLFTRAISNRARLLESEKVIDVAAIDRYAFVRDAYLQRRRSLVHDGNPPPEPDEDDANSKPRGSVETAPVATLVDQFGNLVASPGTVENMAARTAEPASRPQPASDDRAVTLPVGAPAPAAPATAPTREQRSETEDPSARFADGGRPAADSAVRIVKVWLPGSAAQ